MGFFPFKAKKGTKGGCTVRLSVCRAHHILAKFGCPTQFRSTVFHGPRRSMAQRAYFVLVNAIDGAASNSDRSTVV